MPLPAAAQAAGGVGLDALPGAHEVPLPASAPSAIAARAAASYGYTEAVLHANDSHHRLQLDAAGSVSPLSWLALSLRALGRYDAHQGDGVSASDSGVVTETHLTTRATVPLAGRWRGGAELELWLPAGDSVPHALSALSGTASLLLGYAASRELSLGVVLGLRADRSGHAGGAPQQLSAAERLGLGASDAVWGLRQGLAASYRIGQLECLAEWAYRMYFEHPGSSPMWIRAGARYHVSAPLALELLAGVSPSGRPELSQPGALQVVEPRLALGLAVSYVTVPEPPPLRAAAAPAPSAAPVTAPAPPPTAAARGQVLAASGAPLPGASVTLARGEERLTLETDAQGAFAWTDLPPGDYALTVSAAGFTDSQQPLQLQPGSSQQLQLELQPELPIGQIRGTVRRFDGRPIAASVSLPELAKVQTCRPDGTFELDVPPGEYTVVVSARGFAPQTRKARVEHRSVAILIVELERGR